MGVDYYACKRCNEAYPDCGDYFHCRGCESDFCSDRCGGRQVVEDEVDEYGDTLTTCVLCRKEVFTEPQLFYALLKHFSITYEQAVEICRNQEE